MATEHSRRDFLRIAGGTAVGAGALLTSTSSGAPARNASHPSVPGGSGAAPWAVSPPGTVTTASWTADRAVRPMPGSHGVLGSAENVTLTTETYVMRAALVPGQRYRVRSLIYGDSATLDHAGEILFVGAAGGQGLSTSKIDETSYLLLRSGPGLFRTDRVITVNRPVTQLGLRHVRKPGRAVVKTLTIERVDQARPTDCLLSFDVEALHGRAAGPHWIDSLVWGKVDGGEYGIRRICDILDQYSVKASFLIEFASCSYEGERPLREIIDFLGSRGHEIQMHLHSDQLLEFWGLRPRKASMTLNRLSYEMSRRVLDFAATKFEQFVGGRPRVFRSGGLDINENLVNAAAALGIEALSNVREDAAGDPAVKGDPVDAWEPFVWDNGVLELPIDYDYDPLSSPFEQYLQRYDNTVYKKPAEKIFHVFMHSWSLLRVSDRKYFELYDPEHETRLHQVLTHMSERGRFYRFSDYLDVKRPPRPVRLLYDIRPPAPVLPEYVTSSDVVQCNICDAPFNTRSVAAHACPSCGSQAQHRQLRQMISNYGNVLQGRDTLAFDSARLTRWGILSGTRSATGVGSSTALAKVAVGSVDAVIAVDLIQGRSDAGVVADVAHVLGPGGVFVSMTPYVQRGDGASEVDSGDRLYFDEYLDLLGGHFDTCPVPGHDPVTSAAACVFISYRRL